jgi:DNA-directed RNA polymerase subunit M/transcription elongation factor TFIIS
MKKNCPKCGSTQTKKEAYIEIDVLICKACGYDESSLYEIYPQQKTSQKAKGQFSPYKAGGGKRTQR